MKSYTPHAGAAVNNNTFVRSWAVQHRPGLHRNGGFTIIELLVVITVIALLMGIAVPIHGTVKEKANQAKIVAGLRGIATALLMYADQNEGRFPEVTDPNQTPQQIREKLLPYVSNEEIFYCPVSGKPYDFRVTYDPKTTLSNVRLDLISQPHRIAIGGETSAGKRKDKKFYVINGAFEVVKVSMQELLPMMMAPVKKK
ncbi:type II secretion system protein [Planctomycetota bacterium]